MGQLSKEIKDFVQLHADEDPKKVALKYASCNIDLKRALQQIEGQQKARKKIPSWANNPDIIYPIGLSMEQCSSEETGQYKQDIISSGDSMVDLTGGFGIDFHFLSKKFGKAYYVEQNRELCDIAEDNFKALEMGNATIFHQTAEDFLAQNNSSFDLVYIDPARRDANGKKTVIPSDCIPDLTSMLPQIAERCKRMLVKYSPMLDIAQAIEDFHKYIQAIHIVATNNECKELLLELNCEKNGFCEPVIHCINICKSGRECFSFTYKEENERKTAYANGLGKYLYEPNSAIMKAGCHKSLAQVYEAKPLSPNSHLYTSDNLIDKFPGRSFRIIGACKFDKKEYQKNFGGANKANVSVRNCPTTPELIKKKLKISDGGTFYLFATTLSNKEVILIGCEKN